MPDKTVAFDLAKDCKFCVTGIAKAATEASDTRVRQFLVETLGEAVEEQFRLTDIMVSKGWYHPHDVRRQMQEDAMMARQLNVETRWGTGGKSMANLSGLAPHEALELQEIIRSEVVCTKKLRARMAMVQDNELKAFMQNALQTKKDTLTDYKQFFAELGQQH